MSLAVKYRPTTFDEVCGNKVTIEILKNILKAKKFKNMLFVGGSGCGKTTFSKLVASMITGSQDGIYELDCASQNSVDNVRAISEAAYERSLSSEYKIFILDECHMFSSSAWNAFLKILEDSPKYTLFFFCTTDEAKVPQTIRNRLQRYTVSKIPVDEIKSRLSYICQQENFSNYEQACDLIAKLSNGSLREAITSLEKCSDYSKDLSLANVKVVLGDLSYEIMFKLTWALIKKDEKELFEIITNLNNSGQDLKQFITVYTNFVLDILKYILFKDIELTNIPDYLATDQNPVVQYTLNLTNDMDYYNDLVEQLLKISLDIKYDNSASSTILISLIHFIRG